MQVHINFHGEVKYPCSRISWGQSYTNWKWQELKNVSGTIVIQTKYKTACFLLSPCSNTWKGCRCTWQQLPEAIQTHHLQTNSIFHKSQKDSVSDIRLKLKIRKLGWTSDSWEATNECAAGWTRGRPHTSLMWPDSREAMDLPHRPLDLRSRP
jgi:hypothetical protein